MKTITIATRGSKLALWQAEHIKSLLEKEHGFPVELLILKTKGDIIQDVPLAKVGGKGLFVKEIEEALLDSRADIAVHSMKDVPMELPDGLILGVVPVRETPADVLLSARYPALADLPEGAVVGTSSLRRQAQLLALRPDLKVASLRGNVDTRLRKLLEGQFDAVVMAAAGMRRLGLEAPYMSMLTPPSFLPAAGQGALGIEFKDERLELHQALAFLNHKPTQVCVAAERGFLAGLEGGCQVPIAAYATLSAYSSTHDATGGEDKTEAAVQPDPGRAASATILTLEGLVADIHGKCIIRRTVQGTPGEARNLGLSLADTIKAEGGAALLQELYEAAES